MNDYALIIEIPPEEVSSIEDLLLYIADLIFPLLQEEVGEAAIFEFVEIFDELEEVVELPDEELDA
jgi:hypothetical protein